VAKALGVEMASVLNSEELTLKQSRKLFDETMPKVLAANAEYKQIEVSYPGFTAHIIAAIRPEAERSTIQRLPALWDRLGALYARNLTEADMRQALAFYRSPSGSWLIRVVGEGADFSKLVQQSIDKPDSNIQSGDLREAIIVPGAKALTSSATPAQRKDIIRFVFSPAGVKIRRLGPAVMQTVTAWSNEPQPDAEKVIEAAVTKAASEFIENADKAAGEAPQPAGGRRAAVSKDQI
jgi:hypothetical protein